MTASGLKPLGDADIEFMVTMEMGPEGTTLMRVYNCLCHEENSCDIERLTTERKKEEEEKKVEQEGRWLEQISGAGSTTMRLRCCKERVAERQSCRKRERDLQREID
ncbi:hypothetical protein PUN28_010946 [Cardiocondyla obscurior]|uniref:Uncharacterized protein n=1 Tax=Cardiocondyla obscurior TaxID=286306 RepID=A0AAW2FPF0_9HYME